MNPFFNLAFEEYLLFGLKKDEIILFLWQNYNTVVIGNNQNPWVECDTDLAEQCNVKIARRLSGGGAVFHDKGNLNFTFIAHNDNYDIQRQLKVILNSVNSFGLNATFSGRNDLIIGDKKFSGNAFFFGDENSYHHGTLLVDVDKENLTKFLTPSKAKIQSKGIDSARSRVVNLNELNSNITIDSIKSQLAEDFKKEYFPVAEEFIVNEEDLKTKEFLELKRKYASWEWRFGDSPSFDMKFERKFSWGEIQMCFQFKDSMIKDIEIYTDALNTKFVSKLKKNLLDTKFSKTEIINKIVNINWEKDELQIRGDILLLINEEV